ncbi:MAG: hypothetical protein ACKO6I_04030, partial [Sphingomonadales bacterium]
MTLIKSISGIRGTIGGLPEQNLTPVDIVKFASAFGTWILGKDYGNKVVIGRDARMSGPMVHGLISNTLVGLGIDVIDLGMATTPTVEVAVTELQAAGGIIITASHNPKQWNALKLLNARGEFISDEDGKEVLALAENNDFSFAGVDELGKVESLDFLDRHIEMILSLDLIEVEAIAAKKFKIAVDAVNSVGGIAVPRLLKALGVEEIVELNCEPTGKFAHNPEPLPEHLGE